MRLNGTVLHSLFHVCLPGMSCLILRIVLTGTWRQTLCVRCAQHCCEATLHGPPVAAAPHTGLRTCWQGLLRMGGLDEDEEPTTAMLLDATPLPACTVILWRVKAWDET